MKKSLNLNLILFLILTTQSFSNWEKISNFDHVHYLTEINDIIFASLSTCGTNVYISNNDGKSWGKLSLDTLENDVFNTITPFNNFFLAGTDYGNIYQSLNGINWKFWSKVNYHSISSLIVNNNIVFATTLGSGVYKSLDSGKTWIQINNGLSNLDVKTLYMKDTALIAGTLGGGVYFSFDYGSTWMKRNNGLRSLNVYDISGNDKILILGTDTSGVFISNDMGLNWINTNLNNGFLYNSFAIINDTILVASEDNGVSLSYNNGQNWHQINEGLNGNSIWSLLIYNNNVYAGGFYGLFKRTLASLTSVIDMNNLNLGVHPNPAIDFIEINQNYDNHCSTLEYSDEIKIYNIVGECVLNLKSINLNQITSKKDGIKIDISCLPSGIYFLNICNDFYKFLKK